MSLTNQNITDYGIDTSTPIINGAVCIGLNDTYISGIPNVAMALYRRLITNAGSLSIIGDDVNYGINIQEMLNIQVNSATLGMWRNLINSQMLLDERVLNSSTVINYSSQTSILSITVSIVLSSSDQFALVISVNDLTYNILINN